MVRFKAFSTIGRVLVISLMVTVSSAWTLADPPGSVEFFESQIRPILVKNCYSCHSGDSPKGGLSIDTRSGVLKGGVSGPAIVSGSPDKSLIIRAVRHSEGGPAMPPGRRLADSEVAALVRWINIGAPDPRTVATPSILTARRPSWALHPLMQVSPPVVQGRLKDWCRTPIDKFIAAKLQSAGLKASAIADRRTLIRRATYDLTGLPPTQEEVAAFEGDHSADAFTRVVDRLLASPRYGERWGRHWLDVVHYGDTHGYDKDKRRDNAWPYRDYVIAAFNVDKPYSRFVKEQIAGDVLYPEDPQAAIATGMLAAGPWDFVGNVELAEATVEKEKTRLLDRDDVVSTVMSTFASVTIHCARCHDHKFDPISQKDYYRLQAVFAGIDRGDRPYFDREHMIQGSQLQKQKAEILARRDAVSAKIASLSSPSIVHLDTEIHDRQAELARIAPPITTPGSPSNGYHSDISSVLDVSRWVQVDLGAELPITSLRLLPARPTDFTDTPGFGFPLRYRVAVSSDADFKNSLTIRDETGVDVPNPGDSPVVISVGSSARYVRITATKLWPRTNDFVFALAELQVMSGQKNVASGKEVSAQQSIEAGRWSVRYLVDGYDSRNRLPDLSNPDIASAVIARDNLNAQIAQLRAERKLEVESLVDDATKLARSQAEADLAGIEATIAAFPPASKVYAVLSHAPRPIWVLNRGDVEAHGERVLPGALTCAAGLSSEFDSADEFNEGRARADLAEWIVNPSNPLTWRSIVNRVWHYHFTRGIVATPNDFGNNGSKPSHPELLDWLSRWFLDNGQSIKKLHRLIMLSSCYMQSSETNETGVRLDADNRLLWRMNRRRLEAEEVRDSILAVSGKLSLKAGGPGFEMFRFKDDHSPIYDYSAPGAAQDSATFRRTVYEFIVRSVPDPFLECLDCADPNALTPVRNTTITALQALTQRNDPFVVTQSEFLAIRLKAASSDVGRQLNLGFALLYARRPGAEESKSLSAYTGKYGLQNTCRVLLNTNEFMFVD